MRERLWGFGFIGAVVALLLTGCATSRQEVVQPAVTGGMYSLSEVVSDGRKYQVLESAAGPVILIRRSDVAIQIGTNAYMQVFFNTETLKPERIVMRPVQMAGREGEFIYDLNADGMPDNRSIEGGERWQVFYKGAWYDYEEKKDRYIINYQGKPLELTFGSEGWEKVVAEKKPASRKRKSR